MMIKYIFAYVVLSVFYISVGYCQIADHHLLNYYRQVNQAEDFILDHQYEDAIKGYKNAFTLGYGFPVDYWNAFMSAMKIKDVGDSRLFIEKLAMLGAPKNYIQSLCTDSILFNEVSINFDKIRESTYLNSEKPALILKINELLSADQKCRNSGLSDSALHQCDQGVITNIFSFIDSFGFPSIEKTGLGGEFDLAGFRDVTMDLIFFHYRTIPDSPIANRIKNAALKGEYDIRNMIQVTDWKKNEYYGRLPGDPITSDQLYRIDSARNSIGLCTLQSYYKRIKYQLATFKNPEFFCVSIFSLGPNSEIELKIADDNNPK